MEKVSLETLQNTYIFLLNVNFENLIIRLHDKYVKLTYQINDKYGKLAFFYYWIIKIRMPTEINISTNGLSLT